MSEEPHTNAPAGERRLAAIVFTDAVGYSARVQQDETGTLALVRKDFARMGELCKQHGGEVLKSTGDGLLFCFSSVVQAVTCALQIQSECGYRSRTMPPARALEHRIGIHLGDVFREGGDAVGDGVNIAARLQTKARPGTICVSQSVYDAVKGKLPMQVEALGSQSFKNIAEPINVWLVTPSGSVAPWSVAKKSRASWLAAGALAVAAGLAVAFVALRPSAVGPVSDRPSVVPAAAPAVNAKSIAVLPFANLSTEKENEFFADGVQDDVITNLAKIRDLTVISRTSTLAYRDTAARNLKKIAADLGVATVLEGSVRRVGSKVHMNAQLIDARTDAHLWADTFDGDASDIFALQADLAKKIAAALKATLTPGERTLIERRPTQNQDAYELFQRGWLLEQGLSSTAPRSQYEPIVAMYEQAIARDPAFALAHVHLSIVYGQMYWFGVIDPTPERRALARAELETAQRLAPGSPEIRYAQGAFIYLCENDWERALVEFRAAEASLPNDAQLQYRMGIAYRRLGRWPEALNRFERSAVLNPQDLGNSSTLLETLLLLRRYQQTKELAAHYALVFPGVVIVQRFALRAQYALDGDRSAFLRARSAQPPATSDPQGLQRDYGLAMANGDLAKAERLLADPRLPPLSSSGSAITQPLGLTRAELALLRGDKLAAKMHAEEAVAVYRAGRWSPRQEILVQLGIARAQACAGLIDDGTRDMLTGLKELARRDQFLWPDVQSEVARTLTIVGRKDEALACLREVLAGPCGVLPIEMRDDPLFAGLKDDPRFEEILKAAKPL